MLRILLAALSLAIAAGTAAQAPTPSAKDSAKKPGRSLKEKRAAKHEKQRATKILGDRSTN